MKIEDLLQKIINDPLSLSDKIREGLIPFSDVTKLIEENEDIPPVIKTAYLIHPDCTLKEFKKYYFSLLKETHNISRDIILLKSPIFMYPKAIAFVLESSNHSSEAIADSYDKNKLLFRKLIRNPNINLSFKVIYFEVTGDARYLPQEVKDCFLF